jgi:hypothetical protein
MELSSVIPDNSSNWIVRGEFLFYKKIHLIPVCTIIDDIYYVMLDGKCHKAILKLTKKIMKMDVEFYFTTPLLASPKSIENFNRKVVENYIKHYTNKHFFYGFKDIDFDLIHNMVKWTEKENCFDLVKEIYDKYQKVVNQEYYDYYANRSFYPYDEEIREAFASLYRDIQISKLL